MADIAIFRINYKSDFILTLNSDAGWMTPFCIKFWTGAPSQAYFVGFDGTTYTHCAPVEGEPTKLRVQFDDHHLPIGDLKFQIAYHFTVADFPTSVEDEVLNQASVIIEVDNAPAQVMLDFNGETAAEIEFSLPAYNNEAQRIANEEQRIANEQQRIANEEARIQAEETRQHNEQQRINQETARVNEFARLKRESEQATTNANAAATLANEKAQLAADKAALAQAAATLANEKAQLAADKAALAQAAATLANEKAALAQQKAEYAQTQGDYAKEQGDYAKEQGDYAKEQGDTALADHQRAEADHGIAVDDHTQAGNDHTRAESDHGIAVDDHTQAGSDHTRAELDHTQAGNDHTRAESDHATASADHTQAGQDHTRAESDHTRAESDHAAVEVYVDSLGVFDLSKHNAVGGVLATYADLDAALTALNALDSQYKYGGMSFKFVCSSDNKYVQYRLMAQTFSTDEADWQGVDDEPTAGSENLVKSGGVYAKFNQVTQKINGIEDVTNPTLEDDTFYVCDRNGNIVAKIDEEGIKAVAAYVKNGDGNLENILNIISVAIAKASEDFHIEGLLPDYYEDSFIIADRYGNVILRINEDGVEFVSKMGSEHFLYNKVLVTLCDSLGTASQWQSRLAKITGAIYDKNKNDYHFSYGGTATLNQSHLCGQDRAKLIAEDGIIPDVILVENVNDANFVNTNLGSNTDEAFFKTSQTLLSITTQESTEAADDYWNNNFSSIVGNITPSVGSVLGVPFTQTNAVKLTITGAAVSSGNFGILLNGTGAGMQYITVSAGDSVASIIAKIYEYAWNGYVCTYNDNVITFTPTSSSLSATITISAGGTGITYTSATSQEGTNAIWKYFNGHDVSKWTDPDYWTDNISLWSAWKGLVEYLQAQFPSAYIYWLIPKTYSFDYTSSIYCRADGSINYDKVLAEKTYGTTLFTNQIAFCNYYQIPYIDLRYESCITPGNLSTFINVGNVHPKQIAFDRWADVIKKLM